MSQRIPATCDTCSTVFDSSIELSEGPGKAIMEGSRAAPCPKCGGEGTIEDGAYSIGPLGNVVREDPPS